MPTTPKPPEYKIGDYFRTPEGGIYIYEMVMEVNQAGKFQAVEKFVFYDNKKKVAPPAKMKSMLATPPTGLNRLAVGVPLLEWTSADQQAWDNAQNGKQKFTISKTQYSSPPAEGMSLRYPLPGPGEDGLGPSDDYVMFKFYDYIPPYKDQGVSIKEYDYNQTLMYKPAGGYKPIIMYVPSDVSTGFKTNWDGKNVSSLGRDALRSISKDGFGQKAGGAIETLMGVVAKGGPLAGAAAVQQGASMLTGDNLSYNDIFGGISGAIFNPNTELLFGGVQMRNFSLDFKLYARHQEESNEIQRIIKQFNRAILPTASAEGPVLGFNKEGKNIDINLGFIGVPKLVEVRYMYGGEENRYLPRYKMCALTSIDTNFTPDGAYATNTDGSPIAHQLTLGFQETKICFSDDVANNTVR